MMHTLSFLFDVALTFAAFTVPIALIVRWLNRGSDSVLGDAFDASASTLWPVVPEESDPPRWQLDLLGQRSPVEDDARSANAISGLMLPRVPAR
jgi:hypothetical protein